jgi:anti-anti-sigma factor
MAVRGPVVVWLDRKNKGEAMPATTHSLDCEVKQSGDQSTGRVATVICRGELVNQTASRLKEAVKPLIANGGRIVLDFKDVTFVDSMGLGSLVGLKVSAVGAGYCTLELEHLMPRVQELLRLTEVADLFKS